MSAHRESTRAWPLVSVNMLPMPFSNGPQLCLTFLPPFSRMAALLLHSSMVAKKNLCSLHVL